MTPREASQHLRELIARMTVTQQTDGGATVLAIKELVRFYEQSSGETPALFRPVIRKE